VPGSPATLSPWLLNIHYFTKKEPTFDFASYLYQYLNISFCLMLSSLANNDQCNAVPGSSESMLHSYHFLVATTRPTVAFLMAFFLIQATGQKWQWSRIETCLCELCMHRYKGTICTFTQSLQLPRWLRLRLSTKKPASSSSSKFAQAHTQASLLARSTRRRQIKRSIDEEWSTDECLHRHGRVHCSRMSRRCR